MTATTSRYNISLQNMSDGTVQGHAAGCKDVGKRIRSRKSYPTESAWTFDVADKHEAWAEYNADFLAEGPESGDYDIDWMPCADHVPAGAPDTYEQYLIDEVGDAGMAAAIQEFVDTDTSYNAHVTQVATNPVYTQTCTACGETLPMTKFPTRFMGKGKPSVRGHKCRACYAK